MAKKKTTIICWPASQMLMDQEGFRENSALCGSEPFYSEYGDSAYAVSIEWLEGLNPELINDVLSLQESHVGPEVDFDSLEEEDGLKTI